MTISISTLGRNALLDAIEAAIGASPVLKIRTGAAPALPAIADTGTALATAALPADWMAGAANGVKSKLGTWAVNAADAAGSSGHFRIYAADGVTCHLQGSCGAQIAMPASAATAANSNVLSFGSTNGVVLGMNVTGAGIPAGAVVQAFTGTTVTLSVATAGVANGATITFAPDMVVDNAVFAPGQKFAVDSFTLTAPNA